MLNETRHLCKWSKYVCATTGRVCASQCDDPNSGLGVVITAFIPEPTDPEQCCLKKPLRPWFYAANGYYTSLVEPMLVTQTN